MSVDSANLCGFCLQFADSTYSCGFRDSLILLNTYNIVCSWFPKTGSGLNTFCGGFRKVACLRSDFEQYRVFLLFDRGIQNSREEQRKKVMLRNPLTIHNLAS